MAPEHAASNGTQDARADDDAAPALAAPAGPNPGNLKVSHQYLLEQRIRRKFSHPGADPAREIKCRLEGVQLIDSIREKLQLPVKTYNAACTFYHRFRLKHPNYEMNYHEVAMACLFTACKVEDTHKKSREIACARWNIQNPDHQLTQDDKTFDALSKLMMGLERMVLETLRFDFRVRYPQKIIAKIVKYHLGHDSQKARDFFAVAYAMSFDMYKTYVPVKHTTFGMALSVVELTAQLTGVQIDDFRVDDPSAKWHTTRGVVMECLLDLLDLYTLYQKSTKVGLMFEHDRFIDIKISANRELETRGLPRFQFQCEECLRSTAPPSPSTGSEHDDDGTSSAAGSNNTTKRGTKGPSDGTSRFVFDVDAAYREQDVVRQYTEDQFEEYEVEVEETISEDVPDRPRGPRGPRGSRGHRGHGSGYGRGRGDFDSGWTPRNRHDRRRRGGPGYY